VLLQNIFGQPTVKTVTFATSSQRARTKLFKAASAPPKEWPTCRDAATGAPTQQLNKQAKQNKQRDHGCCGHPGTFLGHCHWHAVRLYHNHTEFILSELEARSFTLEAHSLQQVFCKRPATISTISIACLLLYEDYVWVSLGNVMKTKQSNLKPISLGILER
jgi:hypothetical protein